MMRGWPFGRTIAAGFAVIIGLTLIMAGIALGGLREAVQAKDRVIDVDTQQVLDVERLVSIRDARAAANRGFLISGAQKYLDEQHRDETLFNQTLGRIRERATSDRARDLVDQITLQQSEFLDLDLAPVQLKQQGAPAREVTAAWERIDPQRLTTASAIDDLAEFQEQQVRQRKQEASDSAAASTRLVIGVMIIVVLAATALGTVLTRRLRSRIGTAVGEVQSSSAELQATANHQVAGAQQQATTVAEISTSSTELLVTSKQIAESAQQVAYMAGQTTQAGRTGRGMVERAQESMNGIRTQVDTIVDRIVDLGDRSQQIGQVLDIVSELSEQTNILAMNSMIEAAGAGETGRRFSAVADEIRKLADRVMVSTKDIRELINVTQSSVSATVVSIEIGSKAVDAGAAQVEHVATSFEQIANWMSSTTDAAREIELSTKQQAVAVEQVSQAIKEVATATHEVETSSGQTLQTASQLKLLSTQLQELVQAGSR